jgi:hypothetical protein
MIKSKNDYLKLGQRIETHLTIREDIYKQFKRFSFDIEQNKSKIIDILLLELLNNNSFRLEVENKVKNYR